MEEKISQYVNYQFRFDKREDIEDLKAEIIANLLDRYHENLNTGKTSDEAYVAAIKSMGNFSENKVNMVSEEYSIKPSIPDILLLSGAILSIFGLLITMFNAVVGTIITAISIILFSGAAYYLYSYSQYVRKEQMDIEKHNKLLKKIYKYMKTSFAFWAISLSLTMAILVMHLITSLVLIDPKSVSFSSLTQYLSIYFFLFIFSLIIFLIIFAIIYSHFKRHLYVLIGSNSLTDKIRERYEFLYGDNSISNKHLILSRKFFPIFGIATILPQLFFSVIKYCDTIISGYSFTHISTYILIIQIISLWDTQYWQHSIAPSIALIMAIVLITLALIKKFEMEWLLVIAYYFWFVSVILFLDGFSQVYFNGGYAIIYSLFVILILTIILIYKKIVKTRIYRSIKKEL